MIMKKMMIKKMMMMMMIDDQEYYGEEDDDDDDDDDDDVVKSFQNDHAWQIQLNQLSWCLWLRPASDGPLPWKGPATLSAGWK